MKNVLLLGDSIRTGYDKAVKRSLEPYANVYFPDENCRFASYLLRNLHEYNLEVGLYERMILNQYRFLIYPFCQCVLSSFDQLLLIILVFHNTFNCITIIFIFLSI